MDGGLDHILMVMIFIEVTFSLTDLVVFKLVVFTVFKQYEWCLTCLDGFQLIKIIKDVSCLYNILPSTARYIQLEREYTKKLSYSL